MLPVAVVIPHMESRAVFLNNYCLPSVLVNEPMHIFVETGSDHPCRKRNSGAAKAGDAEFLFFCDDDVILAKDCLTRMVDKLTRNPDKGYAYCDFIGVMLPSKNNPEGRVFTHKAREFDGEILKKVNFASTMSLIRREIFPGFDESLNRFQDWNVWLTLLKRGVTGIYIPEILFHTYYWSPSITLDVF